MNVTMKKEKATMNRYFSPDIIAEILSNLPCKVLLRFKVVCKQWESLLHDSGFIDKHRRRHMNRPSHFLNFDCSSDGTKITLRMYEIGVDGYSLVRTVKTGVSKLGGLLPSSYGLVCLHGCFNRKLVILNPNTGQIRYLQDYPEPFHSSQYITWPADGHEIFSCRYFNELGFGFDVKSKRYKAVQLVRDSKTHGISKCYVLTVERFKSHWREINDASLDCKVEHLLFPVCVDGVVYWETRPMAPDKRIRILTFDLRCEKIKMILTLVEHKDDRLDLCARHLVESQGNLCFVDVTSTVDDFVHMDIWMLKYSNDVPIGWAPVYKFNLGPWCMNFTVFEVIPLCINGRRIILQGSGEMYCYDVEEKCLKTYKGDGEDLACAFCLVHTETIVSLD